MLHFKSKTIFFWSRNVGVKLPDSIIKTQDVSMVQKFNSSELKGKNKEKEMKEIKMKLLESIEMNKLKYYFNRLQPLFSFDRFVFCVQFIISCLENQLLS